MVSRRTFVGIGITAVGAAIALPASRGSASGKGPFEIQKTEAEWRKLLTPKQFYVLRQDGTERPFSSPLDKIYSAGTYYCAGCDRPMFSSEHKYDSRTGWPSFWKPLPGAVGTSTDYKLFYPRTEVHCAHCGGHLGHVFKDGPQPTGLRYCMNGVALTFKPDKKSAS